MTDSNTVYAVWACVCVAAGIWLLKSALRWIITILLVMSGIWAAGVMIWSALGRP